MITSTARICGVALAVLLTSGAGVRADLVHWSYDWSRSPSEVLADSPGTSTIKLTDETLTHVVGDSDIVSTNLRTTSSAPGGSPDKFTNKSYLLTLTLTDEASHAKGSIQFSGVFNGTVSSQSSNLGNTFNTPTTKILILGNYKYTVSLPYYTPPGPPSASNTGSISAHVSVELIRNLPEPSSLVLAGLGVVLIGLVRNRRNGRRFPLLPA